MKKISFVVEFIYSGLYWYAALIVNKNQGRSSMAKTSTAEKHNFICPEFGDEFNQDRKGRGFVAHKNNPDCDFERGLSDKTDSKEAANRTYGINRLRHKENPNSWNLQINQAIKTTKLFGEGARSLLKSMNRSARKSYRTLSRLNKVLKKIDQNSGISG